MKAKIENGVLTLTAPIAAKPPLSKSGKTRIAFSTGGFIEVLADDGKQYNISINLTTKGA